MSAITEIHSTSKAAEILKSALVEFPSLNIDGKSGVIFWSDASGQIVGWWPTKSDALTELTQSSAFGPLDTWADDEIMYVTLRGDL